MDGFFYHHEGVICVYKVYPISHLVDFLWCYECDIIFSRRLSDMVGGVDLICVGRLETDSSKDISLCRVWDCLQLWAVKTPDSPKMGF